MKYRFLAALFCVSIMGAYAQVSVETEYDENSATVNITIPVGDDHSGQSGVQGEEHPTESVELHLSAEIHTQPETENPQQTEQPQQQAGLPQQTPSATHAEQSAHYRILSAGNEDALSRELEERFNIYNQLLRLFPNSAGADNFRPLTVRVITDKTEYDNYVYARLQYNMPGAVYLHYNQADRRELVIHKGSAEAPQKIPYQAFTQYIKAFVPNPPAWLREGLSVYFNTLVSSNGELVFNENLTVLESVKNIQNLPTVETILTANANSLTNFSELSWSLVSFFLNSDNDKYVREFTDSIMLLSNSKNMQENTQAVSQRITRWNQSGELNNDYRNYISTRKTFAELIDDGRKAIEQGEIDKAETLFVNASKQRPKHPAPWYYLGMVAFEKDDYILAEQYYESSLSMGAEAALISYARGVNAAQAGRNSEAVAFLNSAAEAAPDKYREKVQQLIQQLPQ